MGIPRGIPRGGLLRREPNKGSPASRGHGGTGVGSEGLYSPFSPCANGRFPIRPRCGRVCGYSKTIQPPAFSLSFAALFFTVGHGRSAAVAPARISSNTS